MLYFLLPFLLLIYFELIGRLFFLKIKKEPLDFSFVIGLSLVMAILYILSWPITAFNGDFYHLASLYILLFIISIILIIKNIKKISYKFDYKLYILFFVLLAFEIFISYHRTLGDPHGFDTVYYVNTISFNIGNHELNSLHPHFGTYPNTDVQWITYIFQSYYYFIGVFLWGVQNVLKLVGIIFEILPGIVWVFEILQEMFFIATSILCIKEINSKNKLLNISFICLLVLFFGNLYYNNVFGFIGNNFRMPIHALSTIYLFRYFNNKDKTDLFISFMLMLGMCSFASTGTFALIFFLFGLFFALVDSEDNLIKYFVVVCFVPAINILITQFGQKWYIPLLVLILFIGVWYLNDFIIKLFRNNIVKYGTIALATIILMVLSFTITHNLFDFNAFLNNYSEIADMSFDYFMFNDLRHYLFNPLILFAMFYFLIKNRKSKFSILCWILIIVIYNPFTCTFMNKINWVYYRTYDIIINNFTILYFINYFLKENENIKKIGTIIVLVVSIVLSCVQIPIYYHETFIPDDDYNPIYKIENSELELIRNVRQMIDDYDIKNPKIINQTFFMGPFIKDASYLFGKEKRYDYQKYDDTTYALYLIFFPHDSAYDNFWPKGDVADYENLKKYLDDCDYDILIVSSNTFFYDDDNQYIQLSTYVEECGYRKSEYSTSQYDVFYLRG